MKKIICIGECALDIIFQDNQPVGSMPGGRIINASAILAHEGLPVWLVSELAADPVGDTIADFLTGAGVDCSSVDRFTDGRSPVNIFTSEAEGVPGKVTRYEQYPDECFDVIWPRIDEGDIVVYGGFYALDPRMRPRMSQLLAYASERKAVLIYLPGFMPSREPRITRVMPAILENLELASVVIARNSDLSTIFGVDDCNSCYHDHISFYCRSMININSAGGRMSCYSGREVSHVEIPTSESKSLMWNAGAIADIISALYVSGCTPDTPDSADYNFCHNLIASAANTAHRIYSSQTSEWQKLH